MLDYTQQLRNVNLNKINTENIMYEYICIPAYVPAVLCHSFELAVLNIFLKQHLFYLSEIRNLVCIKTL